MILSDFPTLIRFLLFLASMAYSVLSHAQSWQKTVNEGVNNPVYFHAWGGDAQINSYIQWLGEQVKQQYNIDLVHIKLADTSEAVSRVLAEKSAGNHTQGKVDLIWINGANFAAMSKHGLLKADWATKLPNFYLTNPAKNPAVTHDFGLPTQGMESPWGQASLTFYYDSKTVIHPPKNLKQLLDWSTKNKGRFTYSKPPDFIGMSFLKYALINLTATEQRSLLYQPATEKSAAQLLPALWQYLDELHPTLWRKGTFFVQNSAVLKRLVSDMELSLSLTFSAAEIPAAVERYDLPLATRSYAMHDGSLSNTHFVAIAYNASHSESAKLVANFMLSVKAQAQKQQPANWGDNTVLDLSLLSQDQVALFSQQALHPSSLATNNQSPALAEPHPSWSTLINQQWQLRYGSYKRGTVSND
ncbi:ABC transporter substrate-binding protein [Pseudoalteromonas sp. L21]|uniref:ABC transporter substrate-binding protein n=1 Tax=Pseudoalteromonas sp. L21 TaxID=1539746 RepID=UPI001F353C3B|nr:ABC transporter substrate-binding protein [Pseudoalteromonas sp. L21]MCF7517691.1 ABC transporter substrate-binding protein [Pseudoalteromonas sp. L21]|tara:strand:+ start:15212 stop:16456 length:1245 start_codon:yes stop_codon:yes gene_type:complete